jgi:hypothetical protein
LSRIDPTLPLVTALLVALCAPVALAQRGATEQALERLEESLAPQVEEGTLAPQGIGPIVLVGATPAFEETRAWFPVAALQTVTRVFGPSSVRLCEACMSPRVRSEAGRLEHDSTLSLPEIARVDRELRGKGAPARSAIWIDETSGGVAVRIVAIDNGQVLFAGNFDGAQRERVRTSQVYNATLELGRRLRGESLTHVILDAGLYPGQHISLDVIEQFGSRNQHMAGLTFSLFDPVVGVGGAYYYVIRPAWNLTLGVQGILSVPTALVNMLPNDGEPGELIDPLLTGVLVARMPIPSTSFGVVAMLSTNLTFAVGISMTNISFLPFVP